MTKAERIRTLYAAGRSTREIADLVGCGDSYVRVVARQRKRGLSPADVKYRKLQTGNRQLAQAAGRAAYAAVRNSDMPEKSPAAAYRDAWLKTMRATG